MFSKVFALANTDNSQICVAVSKWAGTDSSDAAHQDTTPPKNRAISGASHRIDQNIDSSHGAPTQSAPCLNRWSGARHGSSPDSNSIADTGASGRVSCEVFEPDGARHSYTRCRCAEGAHRGRVRLGQNPGGPVGGGGRQDRQAGRLPRGLAGLPRLSVSPLAGLQKICDHSRRSQVGAQDSESRPVQPVARSVITGRTRIQDGALQQRTGGLRAVRGQQRERETLWRK